MSRIYLLFMLSLALCTSGCASFATTKTPTRVRADRSQEPITKKETKDGELQIKTNVAGNTLQVALTKPQLCRDVTTTQMLADVEVAKDLTSSGRGTQWLLGGGAVLFGGIGVGMLVVECPPQTETDQSGQDVERPCTSDEADAQKNGGVGALVLAGVAATTFIVNAINGVDKLQRNVPTDPKREETDWVVCEQIEVENQRVVITYGANRIERQTNAHGIATLDFSSVKPPRRPSSPGLISVQGTRPEPFVATFNLRELAVFPEWEAIIKAERNERAAAQSERKSRYAVAAAKKKAELDALYNRCVEKGDAKACYEFGERGAGTNHYSIGMKKACELNYEAGCIAYKEALQRKRAVAAQRKEQEMVRSMQRAREAHRDPLRRAKANYIASCMVTNGGWSAEGQCKESLDHPSVRRLIKMQCMSLCRGDKMDNCERKCRQ